MNACIVYLVDTRSRAEFQRSLELLRSIPALQSYPILAFHEPDYPSDLRAALSKAHKVRFHEISFTRPRYSPEVEASIPERFTLPNCSLSMGYRHMCRFFAGEIFKRPELGSYQYAMRLDTDSYLYEPVEDCFQTLASSGAVYGFRLISAEHPACFAGFYAAFRQAVEEAGHRYRLHEEITVQPIGHPAPLRVPVGEIERTGYVYYNNFEVLQHFFERREPTELLAAHPTPKTIG